METSQIVTNAAVIEKMAAELYGNQAEPFGFNMTASQTLAEPIVRITADARPTKPPTTAPVSYTHPTLPTGDLVEISVGAASLKTTDK